MKRLIALLMACALACGAVAYAAEWGEGLGPAHPYAGSPEADLGKIIGFILLNPSEQMPAQGFCDTLHIYLPREDVALGSGLLHVYNDAGEVESVDFADERSVVLRPMTEEELTSLIWGSGVCIDIFLPVSLNIGERYYVNMDGGCCTAAGGAVESFPIDGQTWVPVVTGEFGVNGLYYSWRVQPEAPPVEELPEAETSEGAEAETSEAPEAGTPAEPAEAAQMPEEIISTGVRKAHPEVGDVITFELVLGGHAKVAVIYSENNSVYFPEPEQTASGTVTGLVIGEELDWGVVFLDERGEVLSLVKIDR